MYLQRSEEKESLYMRDIFILDRKMGKSAWKLSFHDANMMTNFLVSMSAIMDHKPILKTHWFLYS